VLAAFTALVVVVCVGLLALRAAGGTAGTPTRVDVTPSQSAS